MQVGDICQRRVVTARASETVRIAAERMDGEDVGCVVVVDDEHRPVGVLTDRDIAIRVLRRQLCADETPIERVMSGDVLTIRESSRLLLALSRMRADGLRRAPVVDESGRVAGVLAVDDALGHIARDVAAASQVVGAQRALAAS